MISYSPEQCMQSAIALANQGLYTTMPNPRVGCLIVRDEQIIGKGYHRCAGEAHAEVNAIVAAGNVEGATAYVTLEPCSHTGKTPPCCEALIKAKVAKVVVAMADPNPLVSGRGIEMLREAGIEVELGLLESEARQLNPGFIKRMLTGKPWVRVKMAMSLDGRTAMASGESKWITGSEARSDVQRLRARSCAIVSGVDTVISDNAALTVRAAELGLDDSSARLAEAKQPLRIILDSHLRLAPNAKILQQAGRTIVVAAVENELLQQALESAGAEVIYCPNSNRQIDLDKLLSWLAESECNEVLVEAGATLAGAFTEQQLVDQYTIYLAPTLLGSNARALFNLPLDSMGEQRRLIVDSVAAVGNDWKIEARPEMND